MAIQTTGTGSLSPSMQTYYDRKLLERLVPQIVMTNFAVKKPLPKNSGKTIQFRRFGNLSVATTALTEGVVPAGNSISVTQITATVSQYGDYTQVSDVLDMTALDPMIDEQTAVHADQAAQTIETLLMNTVSGGTNVQYANGRASRATVTATDLLTVAELRKARRLLKRSNVKPIQGNDYVAFVEPGAAYDLMDDTRWQDVQKYTDPTNMIQGEVGKIYGVRVVETNFAPKFAGAGSGSIDVYATIVLGKDAFGSTDISGSGAPQTIVKPHGSAGSADPLNQQASVGWKSLFASEILQQAAIVRIEHAISG